MVSDFRYHSFKEINVGGRIPFTWLLAIPLVFMLISVEPPLILLLLFGAYALSGPVQWYWRRRTRIARRGDRRDGKPGGPQ
jgi:CDP-diacylglycerol--serine O-phosphatidyltransferase